jgi:(p)ppGpp synthase/HD superfamily hydrolase
MVEKIPPIEDSIALASIAHKGQVDKIGAPYIFHPIRVMLEMVSLAEQTVAILHDVLEDTPMTADDLRSKGYPEHIIEAIQAVSKTEGEEWMHFVERASNNPLSLIVKMADIRDNMSPTRLFLLQPDDRTRLKLKYITALRYLEGKRLTFAHE